MSIGIRKSKHGFNIADFCVIIAIFSIAVSVVFRFGIISPNKAYLEHNIELTFSAEGLDDCLRSAIEVGDQLYFDGESAPIGTVKSVDSQSYDTYIEMGDSTMRKTTIPEKITLTIVVTASASYDETEGYQTSSGHTVLAGKTEKIGNSSAYFNAEILKIEDNNMVTEN